MKNRLVELVLPDILVDLVDAAVCRPELDEVRADLRHEASVRGAAACREHRIEAFCLLYGLPSGLQDRAVCGEEGLAAQVPLRLELPGAGGEDLLGSLPDFSGAGL